MTRHLARRTALSLPLLAPLAAPFAARPRPAAAQEAARWRPAGPLRLVVPAAPGGTTDAMARLLAAHLAQPGEGAEPWNVVVDNRSGAGGLIGTGEAVRAAPDGLTWLMGNVGPQAIAYALFRNLPYRPEQLTPVAGMLKAPNILVVHPSVPARTVPEFLAHLRANPGRVAYGSAGVGQSPHLAAVWFCQAAGVEAIHVPFRGAGPAGMELLAGNVQFMMDGIATSIEAVRAGRLRALAVSSAERNPQLPDIPTLRESGPEFAAYDVTAWFGLFGPAGLPAAAVRAMNAAVNALLARPATEARFAGWGGTTAPGTPEAYAAFVRDETAKWGAVIRREGLQLDVS